MKKGLLSIVLLVGIFTLSGCWHKKQSTAESQKPHIENSTEGMEVKEAAEEGENTEIDEGSDDEWQDAEGVEEGDTDEQGATKSEDGTQDELLEENDTQDEEEEFNPETYNDEDLEGLIDLMEELLEGEGG